MTPTPPEPRVGVYIDYRFRENEQGRTVERAFALFLFGLEPHVGTLTLIGRLDPAPEPYPYAVPASVRLVGLPFYASLARPVAAGAAIARGARRAWCALDDVDVLWSFGPNPMSVLIAALGLARRRRVVLGVRQDSRSYVRRRHPDRPLLHLAAAALHAAYRLLSRRCPVAVVGEDLATQFEGRDVTAFLVSLVPEAEIRPARPDRPFGRRVLTVGRLDAEKNPLLLVDVIELLAADDGPPWRLDVVGGGPLEHELARQVERRGLGDVVRLHGYLPLDGGLGNAYRAADAFLHVSWTEGMPQVLVESFAAGLPTVATAVGGVPSFAGDAALLVPPGDAAAAAEALRRLDNDPALRARLAERGTELARAHTLEAEAARVAAFVVGDAA